MKTIKIDKAVLDKTPNEFKNLSSELDYRLTKIESTRPNTLVERGSSIEGELAILCVTENELPAVIVRSFYGFNNYIRTSPIVEIVDATDSVITFRTEGGIYKLEKLPSEA